ncbi:MAG: L-seryl-tRNA(Sec) selenium transferase [Bacillota bacterium]|nr:L-seryl-tRNA(Sec) selenium transferase [Bacillota bacterium]
MTNKYRKIPQVNDVLTYFESKNIEVSKELVKYVSISIFNNFRNEIKENPDFDFEKEDIYRQIETVLEKGDFYSFKTTINATGVVLHTNLGRALLSKKAQERLVQISSSYSNLEYDLDQGQRGSRYKQLVDIIKTLTGAEDAIIVNNNAAAVFLMLNTLAYDKETIVSRGELVEIGDSFRVSEIMERSGTRLIEVGATNRTHLKDYTDHINENTKVLMKVHTSNFKVLGFHKEVSAPELKDLAQGKDLLVLEDLGSGSLLDLSKYGLSQERTVSKCLKEGIDLVSFSCDKLLGGPQGGIIVGRKDLIDQIKKNQLLRAFRVGKLTLAALEATLFEYLDEEELIKNNPTINMIAMTLEEITAKAEDLRDQILAQLPNIDLSLEDSYSLVGGGAYPEEKLPSKKLSLKAKDKATDLERFLRLSRYHIITSVYDDQVHLDLRTIKREDFPKILSVLKEYYKD